jgi:hypothetical protein
MCSWITFREVLGKTRKYMPLKIKIAPKKWLMFKVRGDVDFLLIWLLFREDYTTNKPFKVWPFGSGLLFSRGRKSRNPTNWPSPIQP